MDKKVTSSKAVPDNKPIPVVKVNATEKLREFLNREKIEITLSPLVNSIKTISDGSVIIEKQQITASYQNERQN